MEKRDPAKQRTTSIRKPPVPVPDPADAAPDPDPSAQAPPEGAAPPAEGSKPGSIRRRAGAGVAGVKKYSIGDKMVKTAKAPSKLGAAIKMAMILTVFLGIPGIVTAGFFVKDSKGRNVWLRLARRFGYFKDGPGDAAAQKPRHPNLLGFDQTCGLLLIQQKALLMVRRKIEECDQQKKDVPPELSTELHDMLDKIQPKISECQDLFSKFAAWIREYNGLLGEAEEAFKGVQGDEKKLRASEFLLGGAVPPEFEEAAKDPNVVKYVELCQKLERDKYQDVLLEEGKIDDQARDAASSMVQIRQLRGRLGSRLVEAAPKPETPKPETPKPETPKPEPEKPKPEPAPAALVVPKFPHPWGAFKPGAWIRTKTTVEAGAVKAETVVDTTLLEVKEDGIVVKIDTLGPDGKVASAEQKLPLSGGETKALKEEKLKVGTGEVDCVVLETAGVRTWVAKGGPTAGLATLKVESAAWSDAVNEVLEEALQVGGRPVKCVSLTSEGKQGGTAVQGALWVSGEVPGFTVKRISIAGENRTTIEVTAFGDDAGKKPELMAKKPEPKPEPEKPKPEPEKPKPEPAKPETPKPEPEKPKEKTADVLLAEAGKAVIEGAGLAKQIADGLASPTLDPDQLKTLLAKKEVAMSYLTQARETYTVNKDKASDPAAVEKRLGLIEKVISNLKKYEEEIKSRMK